MYMCFDPREVVLCVKLNVPLVFVRSSPRLCRYLAEVLASDS